MVAVSALRIPFAAIALTVGAAFLADKVFALIQSAHYWFSTVPAAEAACAVETAKQGNTLVCNPYGFDGPEPIRFSYHLYALVGAGLPILMGVFALRRQGQSLWLVCWLLLAPLGMEAVYDVTFFRWPALIEAPVVPFLLMLVLGFPIFGLVLANALDKTEGTRADVSDADAVLIWFFALTAAGACMSQVGFALLIFWRGTHATNAMEELILGGLASSLVAPTILIGIFCFRGGIRASLSAALAVCAALAFHSTLGVVDTVIGLEMFNAERVIYEVQDAIALASSVAGLVFLMRGKPARQLFA